MKERGVDQYNPRKKHKREADKSDRHLRRSRRRRRRLLVSKGAREKSGIFKDRVLTRDGR